MRSTSLYFDAGLDGVIAGAPREIGERDEVGDGPALLALVLAGARVGAVDREDARVLRAVEPGVRRAVDAAVVDVRNVERILVGELHFVEPAVTVVFPREFITLVIVVGVDRGGWRATPVPVWSPALTSSRIFTENCSVAFGHRPVELREEEVFLEIDGGGSELRERIRQAAAPRSPRARLPSAATVTGVT